MLVGPLFNDSVRGKGMGNENGMEMGIEGEWEKKGKGKGKFKPPLLKYSALFDTFQ